MQPAEASPLLAMALMSPTRTASVHQLAQHLPEGPHLALCLLHFHQSNEQLQLWECTFAAAMMWPPGDERDAWIGQLETLLDACHPESAPPPPSKRSPPAPAAPYQNSVHRHHYLHLCSK